MIGNWELEIGEASVGEAISNLQSLFLHRSETPLLDAQVLLAYICGRNRAWVLAHPENSLTLEQQDALSAAVSRLEAGEPLPYVLGHWEFYGLDFAINTHVLIPRPETELMVEQAIEWLLAHPERRIAADIGTGSGCVAVTLAVHVTDLLITATDVSKNALTIAHTNAIKHNVVGRIRFENADLISANLPTCDLICANLPYIPTNTLKGLDVYGREPTLALDGGPDGLSLIRKLLLQAPQYLSDNGLLMLEIENMQGETTVNIAKETFPGAKVDLLPDLAGRDRLIRIET